MEGNQTSVIESSASENKKVMASAVPESTEKSSKYAVSLWRWSPTSPTGPTVHVALPGWNHGDGRIVNRVETFFTQKPEKSVEGKPYSRNTVKANSFRAGHIFSGSLQRKPFSIIWDKVFKLANEALDPSLKDLARQGLISFKKHKRPISSEDLEFLYAANQLGLNIPESLANSAWLTHCLLRKREGVKNNARWNPVTFSSKQQQARWSTSSQARERQKESVYLKCSSFTHSVFYVCKFWDWKKLKFF